MKYIIYDKTTKAPVGKKDGYKTMAAAIAVRTKMSNKWYEMERELNKIPNYGKSRDAYHKWESNDPLFRLAIQITGGQ